MNHVSSWLQSALLPTSWRVAGIACSPLSNWHVFILSEMGSPYLGGTLPDMDKAAEVLIYASGGYAHGRRLFLDKSYRRKVTKKIYKALKNQTFETVNNAVEDFISSCMRVPAHKIAEKTKDSGRSVAAPIAWVLVDFLAADGLRLETCWDMPYAWSRCRFDARRDINGDSDTLESREEEIRFDNYLEKKKGGF